MQNIVNFRVNNVNLWLLHKNNMKGFVGDKLSKCISWV